MRQILGWIGRLLMVMAALIVASLIERDAGQRTSMELLPLAAAQSRGLYEQEQTTTLPGADGPLRRTIRWTQGAASLALWPPLTTRGALALEYLNPATDGGLEISVDQMSVALPPTATARTLHLLLPANIAALDLAQHGDVPQAYGNRGAILAGLRLQGVPGALWPGCGGMPLTVALTVALLLALRLRRANVLLALVLVLLALLARVLPWDSRAAQPALHGLLGYALLALLARAALRRLRVRSAYAVLVGVWLLSTLLTFTPTVGHDGVGYYVYLRSLLIDGDWQFANDFDPTQTPLTDPPALSQERTATDHVPNPWSVGPALVWTPFWLVAHGVVLVGRALGVPWRADGYAMPYLVMINLASALGGLATLLGMFALVRRWYDPALAALVAIMVYVGSNLLFYATLEGSFAHSLSGAAATWYMVATLALDRAPTLRRWLLVGVSGGLMVVLYWVAALLLLVPLLVALRHGWRLLRHRDWRGVVQLGLGGLAAVGVIGLVFVPQMVAWKIIYGAWLYNPQGSEWTTPRNVASHLVSILTAARYGLPWWTPAYCIGAFGSAWLALRRPWPGVACAATIWLYILYNAGIGDWHGSGAFGMRRFTPLAPLCALGVAAVWAELCAVPRLPVALSGAICGWSMALTARYATYQIPHDPAVLDDLSLRVLLFPTTPLPWIALRDLIRYSFAGRVWHAPSVGNVAVAIVGGTIIGGLLWVVRRRARCLRVLTVAPAGAGVGM